ncbi:MAG: hypothetical protein QOE06_3370 [Thermoleophilaceae bacterium]|jgi:hypothetical protein|nr:hypothetical protein [Thermoleophilaceae bacterium]
MSILVRFTPANLTADQYENVNRRLAEGGDSAPDGRELHVCFGNEGELRVSEVWESEEKMQAFGERLMPILGEFGIEQGAPPEILPVVNFESP